MQWCMELERKLDYHAVLSYDDHTPKQLVEAVKNAASQLFRITSDHRYDAPFETTWPMAPNHAWQQAAWNIHRNHPREFWFWWEADATPLRAGWLKDIEAAHLAGKNPFSGHIVQGMGHFNGVAVYPPNICDYAPNAMFCRAAAWDVVLRDDTAGKVTALNDLILHCWNLDKDGKPTNGAGREPTFRTEAEMLDLIDFHAGLFHRCKDGSLMDRIREHNAKKISANPTRINVPQFVQTAQIVVEEPPAPQPVGKTEILIVSYEKDYDWLKYCLKSCVKHARGFHGITVVVPIRDEARFRPLCDAYDVRLKLFDEVEGKGRTQQQVVKCCADQYVSDTAEFVLHMDSDCIWNVESTPGNYFVHGKPVYLKRTYASLCDPERKVNSDCAQWKSVAEKALGFPIQWYTMCRHPTVFPRSFYPEFRQWIECQHGQPFEEWVMAQHKPFPDGFTEFPTMGAFAHEFFNDKFHWIDCEKFPDQPDRMKQFWSHGGVTPEIKEQIEGWLR